MKQQLELKVNGINHIVSVEPGDTLLKVLREKLDLTGTKESCSTGSCGACTVLLNGKTVRSCITLAVQAAGMEVTTIEGLIKKEGDHEYLHPIQESFIENFAVQCGYCTPGMILTAKELLDENPDPTEEEVREAMMGNLCRCTGYVKIVEAVLDAGKKMRVECQ